MHYYPGLFWYARAVYLNLLGLTDHFDKNYFDILPGQTVLVKVKTEKTQNEIESLLSIMSVANSY